MGTSYNCCGFHVHKGTFIIGVIFLIYSAITTILGLVFLNSGPDHDDNNRYDYNTNRSAGAVATNNHHRGSFYGVRNDFSSIGYVYTIGGLIDSILLFLTALLLVIGNRKRKPALYWPFIVYQFISIILGLLRLLFLVFILIHAITRGSTPADRRRGDGYEESIVGLSLLTALFIILLLLQIYFLWVVMRGRKFLEHERGTQHRPVVHQQQNAYRSGNTLVDNPYYQYHHQEQVGGPGAEQAAHTNQTRVAEGREVRVEKY